ncbi:Pr6Pr family membrane protein [Lysobacter sp. CFH 32150]|uniref:Pr6Pr family membrane protein n=1 Tax=Lysobacter sp. CFH 32150 TaxID=2927128 RepID=UPI001FA7039B|nr:Pr6Pr family membrane protein [Lysobacter sp. CFH 32150]MCI4569346.1 Pr6Pr family membrane protein [Lysobacter sp. CFH 32150]
MTEATRMGSGSTRFAMLVAAVSFSALVLQYILLIGLTLDTIGPAFATVRFFSYFTILSNILVTCVAGSAAFGTDGRWVRWFARPGVRGGVAVYIAVTGAVYFLILRHLWQPQGAQWWADSGLHYATPVLYLAWWVTCLPHGRLGWGVLPLWLQFPLGYLLWSLARGAVVHEYPYPFIDVDRLGLVVVLLNSVGVLLLMVAVSALLVLLDRVLGRSRVGNAAA